MKKVLCVGRGYVGGALANFEGFDAISHKAFLDNPEVILDYDVLVNTAGVIGHRKCEEAGYDEVIEANVHLPLFMQTEALRYKKDFIHLSTIGIVETQVAPSLTVHDTEPPFYAHEHTFIYPHNLYCASKIISDHMLSKRKNLILRLPWVLVADVFESRIENWDSVQDTWCSTLSIELLAKFIQQNHGAIGTYHIADAHVYFPAFVSDVLGKHLPIRTDYPSNMTAAVPLDTEKAARMLKALDIELKHKSDSQLREQQW